MHTGLQAQDIFPTVLFVAVCDGRDGENIPSGYKPVFFEWMGWMGWDGWRYEYEFCVDLCTVVFKLKILSN